jgi:hypothetical protein
MGKTTKTFIKIILIHGIKQVPHKCRALNSSLTIVIRQAMGWMTTESSFDFYLSLPSSAKRKERLELYNISRPRLKLGFPSVIQTKSAR